MGMSKALAEKCLISKSRSIKRAKPFYAQLDMEM